MRNYPTNTAPVAAEIDPNMVPPNEVQEAKKVLDWNILYRRMQWHLENAVTIVMWGHEQAERAEVRANIKQAFGFMFGSEKLHESAREDRKHAEDTRDELFKASIIYLAIAFALEFTRWIVEQGILKQAYKAVVALGHGIINCCKSLFCCSKSPDLEQANEAELQQTTVIEETAIMEAEVVDMGPAGNSFTPAHSYGKTTPSAPPAAKMDIPVPSAPPAPNDTDQPTIPHRYCAIM